ncbi:unnamed protein product [Boreogadus saida]
MFLSWTLVVWVCLGPGVPGSGAANSTSPNGKARSCSDLRQFYTGKGFTLNGVPREEMSGPTVDPHFLLMDLTPTVDHYQPMWTHTNPMCTTHYLTHVDPLTDPHYYCGPHTVTSYQPHVDPHY